MIFLTSDTSRTKLIQSNEGAFLSSLFKNLADSKEGDLFLGLKDILPLEPPDSNIIEGNSLSGFSPTWVPSLKVFGAIFGQGDLPELRKEIVEYVVESGDNLWSIAGKFDISLDTLCLVNELSKKAVIKSGQKLIILPVDGVLHLVQSGDTLSEIEEIYKGDLEKIVTFNNIPEDGKIYIGDILVIPDGVMPKKPLFIVQVPVGSTYFGIPTEGKISQGPHGYPRYNAIDVANKCGTPIQAVASGKVYQIRYNTWPGGNFVKISHPNETVTYYGHLSQISVEQGEPIYKGQTIGFMGHTGRTIPQGPAGCHLHFDVFGAKNHLRKYPVDTIIGYK